MLGDQLRLGEGEERARDPVAAAIGSDTDPEHGAGARRASDQADEHQAGGGAVAVEDGQPAALGGAVEGTVKEFGGTARRAERPCRGDRRGTKRFGLERNDADRVRVGAQDCRR